MNAERFSDRYPLRDSVRSNGPCMHCWPDCTPSDLPRQLSVHADRALDHDTLQPRHTIVFVAHRPPRLPTISGHAERCLTELPAANHEAGLTQRDVAERLKEPRAYVSKIEQCQQRLDPLQLVEWLRAIDADEKRFLTEVVSAIPTGKRGRR